MSDRQTVHIQMVLNVKCQINMCMVVAGLRIFSIKLYCEQSIGTLCVTMHELNINSIPAYVVRARAHGRFLAAERFRGFYRPE